MRYKRLSDWLEWQEKLHPTSIDLGLDRVRMVGESCGVLPSARAVVGVAGTNGKGSTVALLAETLCRAGYKVGAYTSPHLRRYNERICIDGEPVGDLELCEAFDFIDRRRGGVSLSFFEFGTLAAFYCFKRRPLDVIVLETGLGGRLDAVNVADLDVTIITSIGIDHTEWLGTSREDIAKEKAGIMRKGKPVICGERAPPRAIAGAARSTGAVLYQIGEHFRPEYGGDSWRFVHDGGETRDLPMPALFGNVQLCNASCVLMTLQCLRDRLPVGRDAIVAGLENVKLEGRFQVRKNCHTLIFDVAHNPHSAAVLADNLLHLPTTGCTHAVFSVLADKDVKGILGKLAPLVDFWHLAEVQASRALRLDVLHDQVRKNVPSASAERYASVADACRGALSKMTGRDRLLIFGSMITVAEALNSDL